jgi:hypothetical protein
MMVSKQTLKEKGLNLTDCASRYVRCCLQNLPYNADALAEVADCAPLTGMSTRPWRRRFRPS